MSPRKNRPAPDPRHAAVKFLLQKYWAAENPAAPDLPWGAAEAGCVGAFLRANPSLHVDVIEKCLHNRLASDDHAAGEGIFRWFRDLLRYSQAPLDRYRLPKATKSGATIGMDAATAQDRSVWNSRRGDEEGLRQHFLGNARRRKLAGRPLNDLDRQLLREEGEL